jgi:hypothetical protein
VLRAGARRKERPPDPLGAPELPLGARWTEEDELRRLIVGEVRAPALVGRQPPGTALGACEN